MSVQLAPKTMSSGFCTCRRLASASRASRTMRAAASDIRWPERPGFAPRKRIVRSTARSTLSGFGYEVAALSR